MEKDLSDVPDTKKYWDHTPKKEIENLKTKVEIESIHAEIYDLKIFASTKPITRYSVHTWIRIRDSFYIQDNFPLLQNDIYIHKSFLFPIPTE